MRYISLVMASFAVYMASFAQANGPAAQPLPPLAPDLPAGKFEYQGYLEIQGQKIDAFVTRTISHSGSERMVINEVSLMGKITTDTSVYTYPGLFPMSRSIGQVKISTAITNTEGKVVITNTNNGAIRTDTIEAGGAYLNTGAGMDMLVARMPLAKGFATQVVTADVNTRAMKTINISVTGSESVNGKPCTVVTLVTVTNEAEKTTLYIDNERKLAVKIEQAMPGANKARTTMLLKN